MLLSLIFQPLELTIHNSKPKSTNIELDSPVFLYILPLNGFSRIKHEFLWLICFTYSQLVFGTIQKLYKFQNTHNFDSKVEKKKTNFIEQSRNLFYEI